MSRMNRKSGVAARPQAGLRGGDKSAAVPMCERIWPTGFGTAEGLQQDFTRGIWPHLLVCVVNRTCSKPPAGQHLCPPTHLVSLFTLLLPSSTPHFQTQDDSHHRTLRSSRRLFLPKLRDFINKLNTLTRALAQDDNSEPRRSPIQVLTAQRFTPKLFCLLSRVV
ncbi:hypothetical protein NX059_001157 [Plenodomus lindquistii]|nr:hypothetical protein NX059_001157 [Plenodomus lindquistii]